MGDAEAGELREALEASEHIRAELSRQLAVVEEGVAGRVAMLKAQVCTAASGVLEPGYHQVVPCITSGFEAGITCPAVLRTAGHYASGAT
jgi:hypothetical protein